MHCENRFCVYWGEGGCSLPQVTLDDMGRCENCILVELDAAMLARARREVLERFAQDEAMWEPKP